MSVIWHDLECGSYTEDLPLWRALADEHGDPVLDVGAGTGRVTLELARAGHRVTALDRDQELLTELAERAGELSVETVLADAREFDLGRRFPLCIVPMQTIQLLGGRPGRIEFLRCAQRHLVSGGCLAIAVSQELETYEVRAGAPAPVPDIAEVDGVVYASQPTAVRAEQGRFVLVRRREQVSPEGQRHTSEDVIGLDRVTPAQLEREAKSIGMRRARRREVPATRDYVGSSVVMFRG